MTWIRHPELVSGSINQMPSGTDAETSSA